MRTRAKVAIAGGLVTLMLFAFTLGAATVGPLFAQTPTPASGGAMTHEQMHQMMDTMHGQGASQRMHEAMGPDAEKLMDQCVAAMGSMPNMQGMMSGMSGMMNGGMSGMMNGGMSGMMGR